MTQNGNNQKNKTLLLKKFAVWVKIAFGTLLMSFAINVFLAPNNITFGGVTGISIIISNTTETPVYISTGILSFVIIMFGMQQFGILFMGKTVFPTLLLPVLLFITDSIPSYVSNIMVASVIGAFLMGLGIRIIVLCGGSTAGPDTIGLIVYKHFRVPVRITMIVIDSLVILAGGYIYGLRVATYSLLVAILMNLTVGHVEKDENNSN